MPIPATSIVFSALENDIQQQQEKLQKQLAEIAKWKQLALAVDTQTPPEEHNPHAHIKASTYYLGLHMPQDEDSSDENTPRQQAFKYALTSIEIAPPCVQRDGVNMLLSLMDEVINDLTEDNFDFYTFMLNKLGPRLDPSNQPLVIEWVIRHVITERDDKFLDISPGTDPNPYLHGYDSDARSLVAEKMLNELYEDGRTFHYHAPLIGWLATLLPDNSIRYIGDFELPIGGKTVFAEAWSVPSAANKDSIIFTDPEYPEISLGTLDLLREFSSSARRQTAPSPENKAILNAVRNMAEKFAQQANDKSSHPTVYRAVLSTVANLYAFKIDKS